MKDEFVGALFIAYIIKHMAIFMQLIILQPVLKK
jgi:hypothetical protein